MVDELPKELRDRLSAAFLCAAFAVAVDGALIPADDPGWIVEHIDRDEFGPAESSRTTRVHKGLGLRAVTATSIFPCRTLIETQTTLTNVGDQPITITRIDSIHLHLRAGEYRLRHYTGAWGREFSPVEQRLNAPITVETRSGRSSSGCHPWFGLWDERGDLLTGSIAWSGNHVMRFEPGENEEVVISGGLNDWEFSVTLAPGETLTAPTALLAITKDGDWDAAAQAFHRWGRFRAYTETEPPQATTVEWNHWWPYEDKAVNEQVFRDNAEHAARLGVNLVTLDAGWFGPAGETNWWDYRGDWHIVNSDRFPSGIRALSDYAHGLGMRFGLWCEIEAVGAMSSLNTEQPDLIAQREGQSLGMLCLGNPGARDWAVNTLNRLISKYALDWVKVDFNIEPGAGCNRTDHGHGSGDGLYRHVLGLYEVLDRVRNLHPGVFIEGCASGGLRLDLGLLGHVHGAFLSDPDTPVHNLQLMWGALDMFAPEVCLHWMWSQTNGAFPSFDLNSPDVSRRDLDFAARTAMPGLFGLSHKLPDMPDWAEKRMGHQIAVYRERIAPIIGRSVVYRLTGQPTREGGGDRWCAFQYSAGEGGVVFVFRLAGAEMERRLRLRGLDAHARYALNREDSDRVEEQTGEALMSDGLLIGDLPEAGSDLIFVTRVRGSAS